MIEIDAKLSRRRFAGAAGALAALGMTRHSSAQENTASPEAGGEWTFTDDMGVTVTLPQRPTRIAADLNAAAPLWDFGVRPISVSGWTIASDASWGNVDRSTPVINASDTAPEPDIERLVAMDAEVFVTIAWAPDDIWSFSTKEAYATTQAVVPVIAISVAGMADKNLQRFADLAVALGIDLETPELVQAKADFDTAVAAFSAQAEEQAELTSLFAGIDIAGDQWYAAYPPDWADLMWYQSLGMNIIEPDVEPGAFWEYLSQEQALKYPCDILFNSLRTNRTSPEDLQNAPLWGQHPAVKAGQIGAWNQDFILSYQGLKAALDSMAATLSTAEKVTD
jgi:iron complex transport system substrate-binding protein